MPTPEPRNPLAGCWRDSRALVIAGGPSLTRAQVEAARPHHAAGTLHTIGVNDAYRICDFLEALYAADEKWWAIHHRTVRHRFPKLLLLSTCGHGEKDQPGRQGIAYLQGAPGSTMSLDPHRIHHGLNGGFQALNIAIQAGARRILLLGFDMQKGPEGQRHWFGDHPRSRNIDSPYPLFKKQFEAAAPGIADAGVEVINCSPSTALTCFPTLRIEEALAQP